MIPLTEFLWVTIPALSSALYAALLYTRGVSWKRLEPAERWLMAFVSAAALWGMSSVLLHAMPTGISPEVLVRLVAIFNFAMPLTVFGFTAHFLTHRTAKSLVIPGMALYVLIVALIVHGDVVRNARVVRGVVFQDYGPAMILAAAFWVFYMYGAGFLIFREWRRTSNLEYRNRLTYLLGVILLLTLGNTVNITPLQAYPIDQLCASLAAGLLALSLTQTQALHAYAALPRVILLVFLAILYVILISSALYFLAQLPRWTLLVASTVIALTSGLLLLSYVPLRQRLQNAITHFFFEDYNINKLLYRITTKATRLRLPQELGHDILQDMVEVLGLTSAVLVLRDEIEPIYKPVASMGVSEDVENSTFADDSPLLDILGSLDRALTWEELAEHPKASGLWISEWENLRRLQLEAIVPIRTDEGLLGFFVLGRKRNGSAYTVRELHETLPLIANQVAIALANSRLYAQVQREAELLARANEELRELDKIKTEIIQNVSHELRTPLTLIQGYAELLNSGMLENEAEIKEAGEVIRSHAQHLYRLVEQLLSFQKLERSPIELQPFDIRRWLQEVVRAWEPTINKSGLQLHLSIQPDVQYALGSREYLRQVIDNLLDNARKFSPEEGNIWIRAWRENDETYISVKDEGIGVPPEKLPYLFERFYQVDGSASRRYGGMGIGLALVKEIIEQHGGQVWAESKGPGTGLTITFTLKAVDHLETTDTGTTVSDAKSPH